MTNVGSFFVVCFLFFTDTRVSNRHSRTHMLWSYVMQTLTRTVSATVTDSSKPVKRRYSVCVSNGPATGCLDAFISHIKPVVTTVHIKTAEEWPSQVFAVNDYGCAASVSNVSIPINCTLAVRAAIAAAGKHTPLVPKSTRVPNYYRYPHAQHSAIRLSSTSILLTRPQYSYCATDASTQL
jgi:hypothetical protein